MPVKYLRLEAGMSLEEFAQRMQIPASTIRKWEDGKEKAPEYVVRLMEYYLVHEGLIEESPFTDDQGDVLVIE